MFDITHTVETTEQSISVNMATKAELLRVKAAIEAGEQRIHDAARRLAVARELHAGVKQKVELSIGDVRVVIRSLLLRKGKQVAQEVLATFGGGAMVVMSLHRNTIKP